MKSLLSLLVLVTIFVVGCEGGYSGNEDEMNTSISNDTVGIDTTAPTVSSTSPSDSETTVTSTVSVTFSETMDTTTLTTTTANTTCSGTLRVSSDSFSSCVQMSSSPSASNSSRTFTVTPSSSLSRSTTYKIRVTTGVKDTSGNYLSSQYETSSGFTVPWTQQLGSSSEDQGMGVTVDSSDNIYVTGKTSGGLDGNTNSGDYDLFLVKYNSSGTKQCGDCRVPHHPERQRCPTPPRP